MTQIISSTRERFLVAIAAQVPPERIAEIHFFTGIKQGGVESGVAVIAARPARADDAVPAVVADVGSPGVASPEVAVSDASVADADVPDADVPDASVPDADGPDASVPDADAPDVPVPDVVVTDSDEASQVAPRFTVYTAHYRLTLKGPDRGKWEAGVVDEADAPLTTVETVVRGVQRRSGDVDDPERLDGAVIREILDAVVARG